MTSHLRPLTFADWCDCSLVTHGAPSKPPDLATSPKLTTAAIAIRFYNACTILSLFENIFSTIQHAPLWTSWPPLLQPPHLVHPSILSQPTARRRSPAPSLHSGT